MDELAILLILGLVVVAIVLPIVAFVQALHAKQVARTMESRLRELQVRMRDDYQRLFQRLQALEGKQIPQAVAEPDIPLAPPAEAADMSSALAAAKENVEPAWEVAPSPEEPAPVPPAPPVVHSTPPPLPVMGGPATAPSAEETPTPRPAPAPAIPRPPIPAKPAFTLEQFMGVKLFAWVGGLALFLGIVFFVKLSIEKGWISREMRTAIGYLAGLGLVVSGVRMNAKKAYVVLGQTLCATGIVVLYGMTFVAHSFYQPPMIPSPLAAFALMSLVTVTAFLLAVRMDAQVVAILGMIGGFLTPYLCSTGKDNVLGLFGFIALLDIGVLGVAKHRRWLYLTALAAAGTIIMQLGWFEKFFHSEGYAFGAKTWAAVAVFLTFALLFTAAAWWTKQREDNDLFPAGSALALCGSALLAAFIFLGYGSISERPVLLYSFVIAVNVIAMAMAWKVPAVRLAPVIAGFITFVHLAVWTINELAPPLLLPALGIYLIFGMLHTAYGVICQRRQAGPMGLDATWVPVVTLLLLLMPVMRLETVSLMVWPALLIVDLGIIGLAILSRSLAPVFAALVLTLLTAMCWLFKLPATSTQGLTQFLVVLGGFGIVFAIASCVLARKVTGGITDGTGGNATQNELARLLPVSSAVLPFALLILAMVHLRVTNPSSVFGLALLFNLFLLGLGRITRITALPMAGLLCTLALEAVWHTHSFDPAHPVLPLLWYLGFHALFTVHPHLFRGQLATTSPPWATAALAGAGTFPLVYNLVDLAWPNDRMGLLPLAFAVPQLLSLAAVLKLHRADNPARMTQLAWFGGMSLLFITLIFPIQFEKQWIAVSWALEGAALCWLFLRVPHPGLRAVGTGLLIVSFVRLLDPTVMNWHVRGDVPIWNWQLYTYSLVAASLFLAAWLLSSPRHLLRGINLRAVFTTLGGVLLFLLLNIEIADAFTPPGSKSIVFDFSGNFARDMTYSISWGLFALALLVIGFAWHSKGARYAGIGLLGVTLLKLFLHDLARLDNIYRIGALIAVAITALVASFLYQRFLNRSDESTDKP